MVAYWNLSIITRSNRYVIKRYPNNKQKKVIYLCKLIYLHRSWSYAYDSSSSWFTGIFLPILHDTLILYGRKSWNWFMNFSSSFIWEEYDIIEWNMDVEILLLHIVDIGSNPSKFAHLFLIIGVEEIFSNCIDNFLFKWTNQISVFILPHRIRPFNTIRLNPVK